MQKVHNHGKKCCHSADTLSFFTSMLHLIVMSESERENARERERLRERVRERKNERMGERDKKLLHCGVICALK